MTTRIDPLKDYNYQIMLQKIFSKPVELTIEGNVITFKSFDDFEFALAARTAMPLQRITDAMNSTPGDLDLELNAMTVAIEQINELIDQTPIPGEMTQSLKAINPVIFSNDNNWRDIFFALKKDRSVDSSKYKLIALTAYLKYLKNRQGMLQAIKTQIEKNQPQGNAEETQFRTGELDLNEKFDSGVLASELGMTSMPKAEPVILELEEGEEIALLLAQYQCKLVVKDGITFIDNNNIEYPMTIGMNKIGRGHECKVRFTDTMQRISRLHLMIINHDNRKLELTDLSTYGTHYCKQSA